MSLLVSNILNSNILKHICQVFFSRKTEGIDRQGPQTGGDREGKIELGVPGVVEIGRFSFWVPCGSVIQYDVKNSDRKNS
jgi:hypothetical protein